MTDAYDDAQAALARNHGYDPSDLRPDLLPGDGSVVAIFVENHQDPHEQDPDYDIWSYAILASGGVLVREHKNTWKVTTEACVR